MKSLRSLLRLLLVLVVAGCAVDACLADGKYFRRLEVADEPGIRAQRAVVAFKDGVETLIVQSDIEGEDTSYGWLLPLPAEPTSIEPCQRNSLNALGGSLEPEIADTPWAFLSFSIFLALVVIAFCIARLYLESHSSVWIPAAGLTLTAVVIFVLVTLLLPIELGVAHELSGGINVLQTVKAGVYDVAVIQGETGEAVGNWLTSNGFASPPSASAIIDDYVADNWCFLAAKVSPDASGMSTHHPLKVTFPASEAVYPLRLTGSDGDPIQLDLYVIGERRASAAAMQTWVSGSYDRAKGTHSSFWEFVCEVPPIYWSKDVPYSPIGIPSVTSLMWPGCVLTRLHARLDAMDMQEDLSLTWRDAKPVRITLYNVRSAVGWSSCVASVTFSLAIVLFTWAGARKGWSWRVLLRRRLAPALLLGLLVGGGRYATLEIVPVKTEGKEATSPSIPFSAHWHVLSQLAQEPPEQPFPEAYRDLLLHRDLSHALDQASDFEKPGDYMIEATEDGWRLTIIDWPYLPVTIPISADGTPQRVTH